MCIEGTVHNRSLKCGCVHGLQSRELSVCRQGLDVCLPYGTKSKTEERVLEIRSVGVSQEECARKALSIRGVSGAGVCVGLANPRVECTPTWCRCVRV